MYNAKREWLEMLQDIIDRADELGKTEKKQWFQDMKDRRTIKFKIMFYIIVAWLQLFMTVYISYCYVWDFAQGLKRRIRKAWDILGDD